MMRGVRPLVGVLVHVCCVALLVGVGSAADSPGPAGALECPCATALTESQAAHLAAKGFTTTYSLQGCRAYDADPQSDAAKAVAGCSVRKLSPLCMLVIGVRLVCTETFCPDMCARTK